MDVSYAVIFAVPADIILNWEEYRRMLHNIGWKTPPDSYKIIKTDRHYYAVLNAICHETNDTPSRIRTRRQFIQALKMQKVYSRGNKSFVHRNGTMNMRLLMERTCLLSQSSRFW